MRHLMMILLLVVSFVSAETYEQCRERLNTPQKIGDFVKYDITYIYNARAVKYRTPEEVFRSRTGGCTDKANFAYDCLVYHGYRAGVYEMWNDKRGHAFTVFINKNGKYDSIESIYGYQPWNRLLVKTIANLVYERFGGPTGIKFVKGYQNWDLRSGQ